MINSKGSTTENHSQVYKTYGRIFFHCSITVLLENYFNLVVIKQGQQLEGGGHQEALTYLGNRRQHAVI